MNEETTLQIEGLSDLELADMRQELRAQGLNLDEISEVQRPAIGPTKAGEPATLALFIGIAPKVAPVIAGAVAAWLLKGRAGKKKSQWTFSLNRKGIAVKCATSSEFAEKESKVTIQEEVLGFLTKHLKA